METALLSGIACPALIAVEKRIDRITGDASHVGVTHQFGHSTENLPLVVIKGWQGGRTGLFYLEDHGSNLVKAELNTEVLLAGSQEVDHLGVDTHLCGGFPLLRLVGAGRRITSHEHLLPLFQEVQDAGDGARHLIGGLDLTLPLLLVADHCERHERASTVLTLDADGVLREVTDNLDSLHDNND